MLLLLQMGLLFGEHRAADIQARTYCEVIMISKSMLDEMLPKYPILMRYILIYHLVLSPEKKQLRSGFHYGITTKTVRQHPLIRTLKGPKNMFELPNVIIIESCDKNSSEPTEWKKIQESAFLHILFKLKVIRADTMTHASTLAHQRYCSNKNRILFKIRRISCIL